MVLFKHMCSWLVVEALDFSILLASQGRLHLCCNCCLLSARPKAWDQAGTSGRNKVAFTDLISSYSGAWASLHFLTPLADKNGNLMKFQPMEWEKYVPLPRLAWEDPPCETVHPFSSYHCLMGNKGSDLGGCIWRLVGATEGRKHLRCGGSSTVTAWPALINQFKKLA